MSVNKDKPYVYVLPEDRANSQLANGFHQEVDWSRHRQMQVLPEAGGWYHVLGLFKSEYITKMEQYPNQFMVLLIDFDGREDRLDKAKAVIPVHLRDRVFILGSLSKPEALKSHLGSYETIGKELAQDCCEETNTIWGHDLLRHNAGELARLREHARSILF